MLELKRVDNIDILTHDVHRLVEFYHVTLGLPFHFPYIREDEWAALDLGNLTLYVFKSDVGENAPRRNTFNAENPPGLDSFSFEVPDMNVAESALEGKVEWVNERTEWKHSNGTWYLSRAFFDPDGNMLYISEVHQI